MIPFILAAALLAGGQEGTCSRYVSEVTPDAALADTRSARALNSQRLFTSERTAVDAGAPSEMRAISGVNTYQEAALLEESRNCLIIGQPKEALERLESAPSCTEAVLAQEIRAFIALGDEKNMVEHFRALRAMGGEIDENLLEEISFAILKQGARQSFPQSRSIAYFAAWSTQDKNSVPMVLAALGDSIVEVRLFALDLASKMRDSIIQKKVMQLASSDSSRDVRLAALATLGSMHSKEALSWLHKLVGAKNQDPEFGAQAALAILEITDTLDKEYLQKLVKSSLRSERALACLLVTAHRDEAFCEYTYPLLLDRSKEVKIAALEVCGKLGKRVPLDTLRELMASDDFEISCRAAFCLLIRDVEKKSAEETLRRWFSHSNPRFRTCAVLMATNGKAKTCELSREFLERATDPLDTINLACHLIRERVSVDEAANALERALRCETRLETDEEGIFSSIGKSHAIHVVPIARYPEAQDLLVRLELYSILKSAGKNIDEPLSVLLRERSWGVAAMTALLLAQEKGDSVRETLQRLLGEKTAEVRIQAATLLALLYQDEEARGLLETAYPTASRELKEQILLCIGMIGSKKSIPFLITSFDDYYPLTRVLAASAVYQCLNH
jgi:HEAT repeat protein